MGALWLCMCTGVPNYLRIYVQKISDSLFFLVKSFDRKAFHNFRECTVDMSQAFLAN